MMEGMDGVGVSSGISIFPRGTCNKLNKNHSAVRCRSRF